MIDKCQLCLKNDAAWLLLDHTTKHVWHELYLNRDIKPSLKTSKQLEGFLVCSACRRQINRLNTPSKRRRRRLLEFMPWPSERDGYG